MRQDSASPSRWALASGRPAWHSCLPGLGLALRPCGYKDPETRLLVRLRFSKAQAGSFSLPAGASGSWGLFAQPLFPRPQLQAPPCSPAAAQNGMWEKGLGSAAGSSSPQPSRMALPPPVAEF